METLGGGEKGRYLLAATFGNVHGVYKPGNVQLRPEILRQGQEVATAKLGLPAGSKPFEQLERRPSLSRRRRVPRVTPWWIRMHRWASLTLGLALLVEIATGSILLFEQSQSATSCWAVSASSWCSW